MNPSDLLLEIRTFCQTNANEEVARKSQRYFKEEFIGYGLTSPQVTGKVREMLGRKELDLPLVLETMPLLIESGKFEETSFGLLLINGFSKFYKPESFDEISGWFAKGIRNWAHADTLGMFILPKFLQKNVVPVDALLPWKNSGHKFQRRCVPVTLIKNLKTADNFMPLFSFIEPLMLDKEREVHQGVGWFLREAWKKKPVETEEFLLKWKDTSPRLIFQYACEKMTAEGKLKFRKVKMEGRGVKGEG